jgi:hypothetical protein
MSDKPRPDVSAPARGLFHVALKKVSGDAIDFEYVLLASFKPLLTVES